LNRTLIPSQAAEAPQLLQPNPTNNPNISDQSGNAVEVEIDPDELSEMADESAKEAIEFAQKVAESWDKKKRGRKPKA